VQLDIERSVLEANNRLAEENRARFERAGVWVVNIMSSPGAGKTSLLEKTIEALGGRLNFGVIEGDIQSDRDARRIADKGAQAVQINTAGGCHLDADMVGQAADAFDLDRLDVLIVENVGNLVCPAEFSLGEADKIMLLSVAEGDDKPMKYPLMFQLSSVLLINKIDLLPHVDCDVGKIRSEARQLNPVQTIFEISCRTGDGLGDWNQWLLEKAAGRP
jgi:hydrogenase nickel incorporation protein HypB